MVGSRWELAAGGTHKMFGTFIFSRLTGESPFFDSRIAYIAETGPKDRGSQSASPSWTAMEPTTRFLNSGQRHRAYPPLFARLFEDSLTCLTSTAIRAIYVYEHRKPEKTDAGDRKQEPHHRPALVAGWQEYPLFDGSGGQYRHLPRACNRGVRA